MSITVLFHTGHTLTRFQCYTFRNLLLKMVFKRQICIFLLHLYCQYNKEKFPNLLAVNGCQLRKNHFSTLAYSKSDDHKLLTRNSRCNRRRPLACHYRKCFEVGQIFILLLLNYCSEYLVSQYFMLFNDDTRVKRKHPL